MQKILFFIALLFISGQCFSQNTLKVTGNNVVVNGSTDIVLKNTQWTNNGTFEATSGTVHIKGNATDNQSAIGGSSTTTFYNLAIDKTANGSQLNQLIQVDNELQMTAGNLDLNNNDLLLGTSNSSIISESVSSYIHGALGGEVIKTVSLNAPVGENPGNIGVAISSTSNLGTTTIYRGHVPEDVNGNVSIKRYYDIVPTNNIGLDATIQLYYFDHELNNILEDDLAPFEHNGVEWTEYLANNSNTTINFVEAIAIDALYFWTLAELVAPLPIELLYFKGNLQENKEVFLDWVTTTEINNKGFEVQKRTDDGNWQIIGWVDGFGNTTDAKRYDFLDKNPFLGINYYRLKQIDFDASFEYSEVIAIEVKNIKIDFEIFPNPTEGELNFSESISGKLTVRNTLGQVVYQNQTETIQYLDLSFLPVGSYYLEHLDLQSNGQTTKFIISKN